MLKPICKTFFFVVFSLASLITHAQSTVPEAPGLCLDGDCGGVPYDMSPYSISYPIVWPATPDTSSVRNVSTISEFQSAVSMSNVLINVAAGTYSGNLVITGNDIVVAMSNNATLNGSVSMNGNRRIHWTGGNIDNGGRESTWRAVSDVLFEDVYFEMGLILHRESSPATPCRRVAFVNVTMDARENASTAFSFFSMTDPSIPNHEDFIFANVKADNASNSPFRIMQVNRVTVVDSAMNMHYSSGTGFRFSTDVTNAFIGGRESKPMYIAGRIHLTETNHSTFAVRESTWDRVIHYREDNSSPFLHLDASNGGVVRNYEFYSPHNIGSSVSISPFSTGGGVSSVQSWDGSSLPSVANYGAQR